MAGPGAGGPVRVLVTGYGAFDGINDNPSGEIARHLAKLQIPGAIVKTEVLPVTWKDVDAFVARELPTFKPDVVVSMGFSAGAHEIKEYAVNEKSGADAKGVQGGDQKIAPRGPGEEKTTLPVDAIMADQKKLGDGGLNAVDHPEPSDDYLCNYVEYKELRALQNTGAEVGFVHLSDVDRDLPAVEQLIRTAVADVEARRHEAEPTKAVASAPEPPPDVKKS
jgi:pyroglutamyl-peptidase